MYAMMGLYNSHPISGNSYGDVSGEKYKVIPKGCSEYNCNGEMITAISEKSAWKKYEKLIKKQK